MAPDEYWYNRALLEGCNKINTWNNNDDAVVISEFKKMMRQKCNNNTSSFNNNIWRQETEISIIDSNIALLLEREVNRILGGNSILQEALVKLLGQKVWDHPQFW